MISCVSPVYSCANHTINTLRYSDRLKEKTKQSGADVNANRGLNKGNGLNFKQAPANEAPVNLPQVSGGMNNPFNAKPSGGGAPKQINIPSKAGLPGRQSAGVFPKNSKDVNKDVVMKDAYPNGNAANKKSPVNPKNTKGAKKEVINLQEDAGNTPNNYFDDDNNEDWEYLKKTAKRDGKFLSEDFIKYHQLTDKIVAEEDDIMNTHLNVIKEDAKLIQKESELIQKRNSDDDDNRIDEYMNELEKIVKRKIQIYSMIDKKIEQYKKDIKMEDELRKKVNPNYFMDQ